MNNIFYLLAAIAIGACLSMQPPINAVMARTLGSPLLAAFVSISITLLLAITAWLSIAKGAGDLSQIKTLPWWIVIGGVAGVLFVVGGVLVAPVTGIALFFVCVIGGQLLGSTVADQLGAFGVPVKPVNAMKLFGLSLVLIGAVLVRNSNG